MSASRTSDFVSNLASSLTSTLNRALRGKDRDQLIRNALLQEEDDDHCSSVAGGGSTTNSSLRNSRAGSPEIPILDGPSVFTICSAGPDENLDPNVPVSIRKQGLRGKKKRAYEEMLSPEGTVCSPQNDNLQWGLFRTTTNIIHQHIAFSLIFCF